MDVLTITNNRVVDRNQASRRYLDVLFEGLKENYAYLDDEDVWDYLNRRN